ncbi:hypothetical protein L6R49_14735 [Myxococcota bacterium]|nr:hypothetical protein [Myxococcota bacterium]
MTSPRRLGVWLGLLGGCAPPGTTVIAEGGTSRTCEPLSELAEDEVRIKLVGCNDELPRSSEGRIWDWLIQNSRLSVIVRQPGESLSIVGGPGLTVVDAAVPGWNDRLFELIPLIDGLALRPERWEEGVDEGGAYLRVEGVTEALRGLPVADGAVGEAGSFTWRLAPGSNALTAEGATSLYLHGGRSTEALGAGYYHSGTALVSAAEDTIDLGGARILRADTLFVGLWPDVHEQAWPEGARASGSCSGDDVRVLDADGGVLARLPVEFDSALPPGAVSLVCLADGHADGAPVPIGEGLSLSPGEEGRLRPRVIDGETGESLPALVTVGGRRVAMGPEGGDVGVGPGVFTARVEHGPAYDPWEGEVTVSGDTVVDVILRRVIPASLGWVPLDLDRPARPARDDHTDPADALAEAAALGIALVVFAPEGEIGELSLSPWWSEHLRAQSGSEAVGDGVGAVVSFPWDSNSRLAGHGAVNPSGLDAEELAVLAMGSVTPNRVGVVDAAWVRAAGPPGDWPMPPDGLRLTSLDELPTLLALYDRGARVAPVGPLTFTAVDPADPLPSVAALTRGLATGRTVASAGPLLLLTLDDEDQDGARGVTIQLYGDREAQVESVELWVDGALVTSFAPEQGGGQMLHAEAQISGARYALAVARGESWAVSAPVWLDLPPEDTAAP